MSLQPSVLYQSASVAAVIAALAVVGVLLAWWRTRRQPAAQIKSGNSASIDGASLAEQQDIVRFMRDFRGGALAPAVAVPEALVLPPASASVPAVKQEELEKSLAQRREFAEWVPAKLATLQKLVAECREDKDQKVLREYLERICEEIAGLKLRTNLPELRPAWQVAAALEGLLKQLIERTANINHSTLRTIASAQELLNDLCLHGARNDLATVPAIRILAVDDDAVSRFALSLALKKVFDEPDVAENARTALELIQQRRYDLIILDVMMPDFDGFEVCEKIRERVLNEATPVLFVTSMQDFDARTRALSSGGSDLVGKPFLTFEMAVKVLTMILRFRLRDQEGARVKARDNTVAASAAVLWPEVVSEPVTEDALPTPASPSPDDQKPGADEPASASIAMLPPAPFLAASGKSMRNFNPEFLRYMDAFGPAMKRELTLIGEMKDDSVREEALLRLHLRLQTLSRRINEPELQPAFELSCAVEGLAKRLRADSKKATRSALRSLTIALELLKDLCLPGVSPDLYSNPAIQLLVVDDEPLARRALTGALQLTFGRPDGADGVETALALSQEKEFDVIFLDVSMPQLDGFEVCRKMHEFARNRTTPVVFVTNHSDDEFRSRADKCGAKDFIVKPFDFVEIPVKALTYALRGRLEKLRVMPPAEPGAPVAGELKTN